MPDLFVLFWVGLVCTILFLTLPYHRGPKGELGEVYKSLPDLLNDCRACLSANPVFVVTTVYAVRASAIHMAQAMNDLMTGFGGKIDSGELVTREQSAGRLLSQAV